jgi:TolB-like protein/Tfp pilus assembly protein PilF
MTPLRETLQRRKLVQWVLAYLAFSWLLLQVIDLLGGRFGWPDAWFRIATVILGVGVLAAGILAWYHGERGAQRATGLEIVMLTAVLIIAAAAVALVGPDASASGDSTAKAGQPADQNSLAVLPFVDLSPNKDQEYFSDGITEEILNALAKVQGLRVPARTSSFAFKGKNLPISEIASALRVRHVLEGTVRKAGDRLKITAQLIDPAEDRRLWSQDFDEKAVQDVFAIQEDIARAIVLALQPRLGLGSAPLVAQGTQNVEAYNLYLQGRHFWNRRNAQSLQRAIQLFEEALRIDPAFARAQASIAEVYIVLPTHAAFPERDARKRAEQAVRLALAKDSTLAPAHTVQAALHEYEFRWDDADRAYRRAVELDPGYATAWQWYSMNVRARGQLDEALRLIQRAREVDPLSLIVRGHEALLFSYLGREREADAAMAALFALDSTFASARITQAQIELARGNPAAALTALNHAARHYGEEPPALSALRVYALAKSGQRDAANRQMRELETAGGASPAYLALAYVGLDRFDDAFIQLNRGADGHALDFAVVLSERVFDPIRSDPRYAALLRKMRLQ